MKIQLDSFKNGELHHGLRGSCGDLLILKMFVLGLAMALLMIDAISKSPKTKSFMGSIMIDESRY